MSEWGTIIDRIETLVRAAVTIPSGEDGFERNVGDGSRLPESQLPHVYAHDPTETVTELPFQQRRVQFQVQLDYWTRDATQESVNTDLDAIRDQILGDSTLNGAVDFAFVSSRSTVEAQFIDKPERAGVLLVTTRTDV